MTLGSIVRKLSAGIILAVAPTSQYAPLMRVPNVYAQEVAKASELPKTNDEALPVLKKNRLSYDKIVEAIKKDPKGDKAGNYEKLKYQYLDQLLVEEFKIVYDKKRNPDGFVNEWFYWPDEKQRKKAEERIRADLKFLGLDTKTNLDSIKKVLFDERIMACSRDPPGQKQKLGYVVADHSVFDFVNEYEVFSWFDHVRTYLHDKEFNMSIDGKTPDLSNGTLTDYRGKLIALNARAYQLINVLNGKRDVSDGFRYSVATQHLKLYGDCKRDIADLKKEYKEHDNESCKDAYEFMECVLNSITDRMKTLGYEHKQVSGKYELVKISEKKDETPPKK